MKNLRLLRTDKKQINIIDDSISVLPLITFFKIKFVQIIKMIQSCNVITHVEFVLIKIK